MRHYPARRPAHPASARRGLKLLCEAFLNKRRSRNLIAWCGTLVCNGSRQVSTVKFQVD